MDELIAKMESLLTELKGADFTDVIAVDNAATALREAAEDVSHKASEDAYMTRAMKDGLAYYWVMMDTREPNSIHDGSKLEKWKRFDVGHEDEMALEVLAEVERRWPGQKVYPSVYGGVLSGVRSDDYYGNTQRADIHMLTADGRFVDAYWSRVHG
jgi:hypothetical protein